MKPSVVADSRPDIVVSVKNAEIVDNLYLGDTTDGTERRLDYFKRKYKEEDFNEGDQGIMVSVNYANFDPCEFVRGLEFWVRFSFWHDVHKTKPCFFYESTIEDDRKGNPKYFDTPAGDEKLVSEALQHSIRVNRIKRRRVGSDAFHLFVPSWLINWADLDTAKINRNEIDTLFMFADIYNGNGQKVVSGTSYVCWLREPNTAAVGNECLHLEADTTDVEIGRWKIDEGMYLVKFNRKVVCRLCGRKFVEQGIERTESVDKEKSGKHKHVWRYLNDDIDYNSLKREPSSNHCYIRQSYTFNVKQQCLICEDIQDVGTFEDATILQNSNALTNQECCPGGAYLEDVAEQPVVTVGDRQKMDKVITTYFYCPDTDKKRIVGKRTETEWSEPCMHDFMLVGTDDLGVGEISRHYHNAELVDHYRCKKCGMLKDVRRTRECSHQYERKVVCAIDKPWMVEIKGVPLKMQLVCFENDSTAAYVAETETTQQLWKTVCPENDHGWHSDSTYPAAGVTSEEVAVFISRLNTMASEQGLPVSFRLPKASEWTAAYKMGGDEQGWVREYGTVSHPVAELPANKLGLFDMKGNVAELCSDTASIGDESYKTVHAAVGGLSFQDGSVSIYPGACRWVDMSEGQSHIGFRLFADPVDGDESKLTQTLDERIGGFVKQIGNWWLHRSAYQCKVCGYVYYSPFRFSSRALNGKSPITCR